MRYFGFVSTLAACVIALTACSDDVVTPVEDDGLAELVSSATVINELTSEMQFEDGTIANEVRERPSPERVKRGPSRGFDKLLRALKLNEEQLAQTKTLLDEHKACVEGAVASLRAAERALLDAAEAERLAIKEKATAGEITREEAAAAIKAVNQRLREALRALPEREGTREAIKNCDAAFIDALNLILTEEQQAIVKRWLAAQVPPKDGGRKPEDGKDRGGRGPKDRPVPDSTNG